MLTAGIVLALIAGQAAAENLGARRIEAAASGNPEAPAAQVADVVAGVRVQGNVLTPDDEIVRLAGVQIGASFAGSTLTDAAARLQATGKFEHVEVLKRFASLDDPTRIVIVIIVS